MPRSGEDSPGAPGPPFSGGALAERRARAARVGAPYLVPIALVAVTAAVIWAYREQIQRFDLPIAAASPEKQVREALHHQDRAHLADVYGFKSGGTAELYPVRFADVSVAADGGRARVVAVVEAEGQVAWRAERASLSYVGRERFEMTPCGIALWCGDGQQFAALRAVLSMLFRRADAVNGRDVEACARLVSEGYAGPGGKAALQARLAAELEQAPGAASIRAWQIRVERDRAIVGEDYELPAAGRPPDRRRARYTLRLEDGRWRFVDGL